MLNIQECKQFAQDFAKNELGRELDIPVVEFNRMKCSGAFRYSGYILHEKTREGALDIRIKLSEETTEEELKGTIKHEVIHWYCYVSYLDYHDGDKDFELHHIEKPYTVYYNDELICYVFDLIHKQWHMIDTEGRSYEKGCYKTRKDATTEAIFQFEQNESKVI